MYSYGQYYVMTIDAKNGKDNLVSSHALLEDAIKVAKLKEDFGFSKLFSDVQVYKGHKMVYSKQAKSDAVNV